MQHLTLAALPTDVVALLNGLDVVARGAAAVPASLPWILWNLTNDGWYTTELLERLAVGFRAIHARTGLRGAALVQEIARYLSTVRVLDQHELNVIPLTVVTHAGLNRIIQRYRPTGTGWWAAHSITEIMDDSRSRSAVLVRPANYRGPAWFSFGTSSPNQPDEICRQFGLPWKTSYGEIVRLRGEFRSLRKHATHSYIPTFFDSYYGPHFLSVWRARPLAEKKIGEPWGTTRDLITAEPRHPEILVELTRHDIFKAERIGQVTREHSEDYLNGSPI